MPKFSECRLLRWRRAKPGNAAQAEGRKGGPGPGPGPGRGRGRGEEERGRGGSGGEGGRDGETEKQRDGGERERERGDREREREMRRERQREERERQRERDRERQRWACIGSARAGRGSRLRLPGRLAAPRRRSPTAAGSPHRSARPAAHPPATAWVVWGGKAAPTQSSRLGVRSTSPRVRRVGSPSRAGTGPAGNLARAP